VKGAGRHAVAQFTVTFSTVVDAAPLHRLTFERSDDRTNRVAFPPTPTAWQARPVTSVPLWQDTRISQQAFALSDPAVCVTVHENPPAGLPSQSTNTLVFEVGGGVGDGLLDPR
jgi:hypothetical protein